jgi:ABC-type uncharacterized transport system ATPase component
MPVHVMPLLLTATEMLCRLGQAHPKTQRPSTSSTQQGYMIHLQMPLNARSGGTRQVLNLLGAMSTLPVQRLA